MILKNIKAEHKDARTGLVLKKIETSEWERLNRKIAVNNSLIDSEQKRITNRKPILDSPFQVYHIPFIRKKKIWDFEGVAVNKAHATRQKRLYFAFQQRTEKQWNNLNFAEAENDYQDLATRGLPLVPYPIKPDSTLDDWKKRRQDAISILNEKSQKLVPVFCSKHHREKFEEIFNYEFENSKIIGVQCYGLNDATTSLNLTKIKLRNMMLQSRDDAPLLLGLNYEKVLRKLFNISGSFAYSCYGFDILSHRQVFLENMPPKVVKKILSTNVEEVMKYDKLLGGFNLSAEQQFWEGVDMTNEFLENVPLSEWLTQYQAIQWANHREQQDDLDILNNHILETSDEEKRDSAINYIETEKEKWAVYWKTKIARLIPK